MDKTPRVVEVEHMRHGFAEEGDDVPAVVV